VIPSDKKYQTFLHTFARYLLAVVFIASAIGKAISPRDFYSFVSLLPFTSFVSTTYFLALVVVAEVMLAILLIVKRTAYLGGILSSCALFVFLVVLISASYYEVTTPCGCFGALTIDHSIDASILIDIVLFCVAAIITNSSTDLAT
jgi:hypothetical protein